MTIDRNAWTLRSLLACALVLGACGDDDAPDEDAGTPDAMVEEDAGGGVDSGPVEEDAGTDAGPMGCTEGCAIEELVVGFDHVCGRRENGEVLCWGGNVFGQLGDDRMRHGDCSDGGVEVVDCSAEPVSVVGLEATTITANGGPSNCALSAEGVFCWGLSDVPPLGSDQRVRRFLPEEVMGWSNPTLLDTGSINTCGTVMSGAVRCSGDNTSGQLGDDSEVEESVLPVNVEIADALEVDVASGGQFACARTASAISCWGSDRAGQLGNGEDQPDECTDDSATTYDCSRTPVEAEIDASTIEQMDLGSEHVCALQTDGTVVCWGANFAGQLGLGNTDTGNDTPQAVPGLSDVTQIAVGHEHSCAISGGSVFCWGSNEEGQIGDGSIEGHSTCTTATTTVDCLLSPTEVDLEGTAVAVAAGFQTTCALLDDGSVWCWGWNGRRQLGREDRLPSATPLEVAGLE
ncbi:MAG TPA: hypothetical protein RMH85_15935 [Polyangiaceae bacterium LLY-WYZ-15_(1-7)]|nr:hypothetical protein [Sandaracinus sp.]HJL01140.1 hypothetical protein [Polyangiaceae bacterium LLY-WYZ-15_(1-7)]MBJ71053.1 hypothetical protein [Sandaracinus sp.]HJL09991.1 hypothetical protein [Polyangiaceae bacterium LLY-WYZ-15_(1-7)]HJL27133.1 hypothetical protein [Polyangiaceae bacterium LLY-WYZ-15_(1-7)]